MRLLDHVERELDHYFKAGYQMHPSVWRYLFMLVDEISGKGLSGAYAGWVLACVYVNRSAEMRDVIEMALTNEYCSPEIKRIMSAINTRQLSDENKVEVLQLFTILAIWKTLTPLQGTADEWDDMSEYTGSPHWQNNRDSRVFKEPSGCYFIDAYAFEDEDGYWFTNKDSHIPIDSFPYMPPEKIYVPFGQHNHH